jgi:hypothetical protein
MVIVQAGVFSYKEGEENELVAVSFSTAEKLEEI